MNTQAASLLAQASSFMGEQFPAVILINGQGYSAAKSGTKGERDLVHGGWLVHPTLSFWLPVQAFITAGQVLPRDGDLIQFEGKQYRIKTSLDGANATTTLRCEVPDA